MDLKEALRKELTDNQMEIMKRGFDIIGDVAVIEIPKELEKKEREIALALLKVHPHLKTVLKKTGRRKGKYRLRGLKIVFGSETETVHREHGYMLYLDVMKVYFSPRESTERQRIAGQVKPGERVLVMFAGIGPYALAIAKKQPDLKSIYAVEANGKAFDCMETNIRINKLAHKIIPVRGDVKKTKFSKKFERIVMPLPKEGYRYLDVALKHLKPGGVLHFYFHDAEENLYKKAEELLKKSAEKKGRKIRILHRRRILPYAPRVWKICVDAVFY